MSGRAKTYTQTSKNTFTLHMQILWRMRKSCPDVEPFRLLKQARQNVGSHWCVDSRSLLIEQSV